MSDALRDVLRMLDAKAPGEVLIPSVVAWVREKVRAALGGAGQQEAPDDTRPGEAGTVTLGKPCARCGGTEYRCANCQDDDAERGDHTLSPARKVACERVDGTLNVHAESETCDVCARPQPPEEP